MNEIVIAACCQCGRNRIPTVTAAASLESGLRQAIDGAEGLLLDPLGADLAQAVKSTRPIALAVGAEGGFDDSEKELAARLGYRTVRLGPRILRTETAGLVGLAILQATVGDLR